MGKNDAMVSSSVSTTSSASNCATNSSAQYNAGFINYSQAPNVYINNQKVEQNHYPAQNQFSMQAKMDSHFPTLGQPAYHPQHHSQTTHQMPTPTFTNSGQHMATTTAQSLNIPANNNMDSHTFSKSSLPLPTYYIRNNSE